MFLAHHFLDRDPFWETHLFWVECLKAHPCLALWTLDGRAEFQVSPFTSFSPVFLLSLCPYRCANIRPGETVMDVTSRCTLGDPNKLPEGVPQPARMPYISDKHPRQTLEVINLLRKHRELCDVVLVVGAKKIYAHRVILSACSPYFRAMFTGELAESRQTEVVIRDIDERAMELLIDFAYTSQITVEEGNVQTLLPAACLLQLAEIQEACCEFLKRQLDPSNCLGIRAFADTHSCHELLRIADKFTQHKFQEVHPAAVQGWCLAGSCGLTHLYRHGHGWLSPRCQRSEWLGTPSLDFILYSVGRS